MLGPDVRVVDSAHAVAADALAFLEGRGLARKASPARARGRVQLLVTDLPKAFESVAARFLGEAPESVEQVDL
jgi:glutamate racemase